MIIAAKLIRNPRKYRHCGNCGSLMMGKQLRLYGNAEDGDKPYVIYVHPYENNCHHPAGLDDKKVITALEVK